MTVRTERTEATAFQPAREAAPSPAFLAAYTGDRTPAQHVGGKTVAEHGFPSSEAALRALGLAEEPKAVAKAPHADGLRVADDPAMDKLNRRNTGPYKSDTVSNDQMKQWEAKFDEEKRPGITAGSLMTDMDKAAAAAGTNPDGSPKVSIGRARDQEGITHYYAMFNQNQEQLKTNKDAVAEGNFQFQSKDGTKAAIAEIGIYRQLPGGETI